MHTNMTHTQLECIYLQGCRCKVAATQNKQEKNINKNDQQHFGSTQYISDIYIYSYVVNSYGHP